MDELKINDRVTVVGKKGIGTIAFIGNTHFSKGLWLGIELDQPVGRNNGSYEGIRYFKCSKNHGIFSRPCQVKKIYFKPPESAVRKEKSRKNYPNYLRDASLSNPNEKHDRNVKKRTLLEKVRKHTAFTSTSMPFISPEEDVNLNGDNSEVKPKPITQSEKNLTEKQFSQEEKEAKDFSPDKGTIMQTFELRDMISKTTNELKEVNLLKLGRNAQKQKYFPETQFPKHEKEAKDSFSEKGNGIQGCEYSNMNSKTSIEFDRVKDKAPGLHRRNQTAKAFHKKQIFRQEKEAKDSSLNEEEGMGRTRDLEHMISKTSEQLNEVKDYVLNLDRKLKLLKVSLREEIS